MLKSGIKVMPTPASMAPKSNAKSDYLNSNFILNKLNRSEIDPILNFKG